MPSIYCFYSFSQDYIKTERLLKHILNIKLRSAVLTTKVETLLVLAETLWPTSTENAENQGKIIKLEVAYTWLQVEKVG